MLNLDYVTDKMDDIRLHFWINSKIANQENPAKILEEINKKKDITKYWSGEPAYVRLFLGECDASSFGNQEWNPIEEETKNVFTAFLNSNSSKNIDVFNPALYIDFKKYIIGDYCPSSSLGKRPRTGGKYNKSRKIKRNKNKKNTKSKNNK